MNKSVIEELCLLCLLQVKWYGRVMYDASWMKECLSIAGHLTKDGLLSALPWSFHRRTGSVQKTTWHWSSFCQHDVKCWFLTMLKTASCTNLIHRHHPLRRRHHIGVDRRLTTLMMKRWEWVDSSFNVHRTKLLLIAVVFFILTMLC